MSSHKAKRAKWRALLTDTLPYEVPVIFSNDIRYASLLATLPEEAQKAFDRATTSVAPGTVPYQYSIKKEEGGSRTELSIVHPLWQTRLAEFYDDYGQSMLDYCRGSEFSLRRPIGMTPVFSKAELAGGKTFKLGIPHVDPDEGAIDVSHIVSHFAYGRYNLLSMFIESKEFLALEQRFSRLRTLDVSKCFFSIYTHTITWAVKEKVFAKEHRHAYSFEGRFDDLMQKANFNETHGIVVGPEISRIFAEIIFQDIDKRIQRKLLGEQLIHDKDYAIRRYVDDYYVFSRNDPTLDLIEPVIRDELQKYKLYLNEKKVASFNRPFVTSISHARRAIGSLLSTLHSEFDNLAATSDPAALKKRSHLLRQQIREVRFIASRYDVGLHTVSGWLLSSLREVLKRVFTAAAEKSLSTEQVELYVDIASDILEVVFYVCALDTRVRTTYSLCQIISIIGRFNRPDQPEQFDRLRHVVSEGLLSLIQNLRALGKSGVHEGVELFNLLICGAHYLGPKFFQIGAAKDALDALVADTEPSYFKYITAKFCLLKDPAAHATDLKKLNASVLKRFSEPGDDEVRLDSEQYLLMCDIISAPDISPKQRRDLFLLIYGGKHSHKAIAPLQRLLGFVDWEGLQIDHLLERKQLRPVYSFS